MDGARPTATGSDRAPSALMRRAFELADRSDGRTSPNPAVGAIISEPRDGRVISEGRTAPAGGPHAEVEAIRRAGERARGAALHVTLEPCSHHGRTPPCVEAILDAGIVRVHIAMQDPNPRVAGSGIARLRAAGIDVVVGDGRDVAVERYAPFAHWILTGRPHVTAKYAMTLDGRIATRTGHSRWITGRAARRRSHELRDVCDAILVGAGTVIADDPALTTRLLRGEVRHPIRVVLDSHGRVPLRARVFDPSLPGQTCVATVDMAETHAAGLRARDVEVVRTSPGPGGRVHIGELLDTLGRRDIVRLIVEGGSEVLGSFFDGDHVQRIWAFVAPKVVGGKRAPGPVGGEGVSRVDFAHAAGSLRTELVGDDVLIIAELQEDRAQGMGVPDDGTVEALTGSPTAADEEERACSRESSRRWAGSGG